MLLTEQNVRDNLRNRDGKRVFYLGKNDRLTSGARDFLAGQRIEILPAEEAKPQAYQLLNGGFLREKPEHMTHLRGNVLVEKTHPVIAFRGKMDTLESLIMLCQLKTDPETASLLAPLLALARKILRCDVLQEPLEEEKIWGFSESELHSRSHRPQDFYGQPHFMPEYTDGEKILRLNRVRCAVREAELAAAAAFGKDRQDLLKALNRMSSAVWILMIRAKKEREEGS